MIQRKAGQWRTVTRAAIRPQADQDPCAGWEGLPCGHVRGVHRGLCIFVGCKCKKFRAIDSAAAQARIRASNRRSSFGSRHERLSITDVELAMARGQSDVVEIRRQVDIPLGLRAGSHSVFRADALATLKPGGAFTHRIYEPKGIRMPIYLLKRAIVILKFPQYEFVEIG